MTQVLTDSELLKAYLDGDLSAFTRLRECHVTMVHATALRLAPAQAEDVTQAVFLLLAQRAASLRGRASLGGWLYKSTCLCAKAARRLEARRHKHEREAAIMRPQTCSSAPAPAAELLPLLDPALATLGKADRDVVVLRYLQNQSLDQVGAALGLSTAAATKRAQRAVEKLRDWFIRHGHEVSGSALSSTLAVEAARQAPIALLGAPASPNATILAAAVRKAIAQTVWTTAASVAAGLAILVGVTLPALRPDRTPNRPGPVVAAAPAVAPTSAPTTMAANPLLPDTAIITARDISKGRAPQSVRIYFQRPANVRIEYLQVDGTIDASKPADVISGGVAVKADNRSKLFVVEPVASDAPSMVTTILSLAALRPPDSGTASPPITVELAGAPKMAIVLEPRDASPAVAAAPTTAPALRRFEACLAGEPDAAGKKASVPLLGQARVFLSYDQSGVCRRLEMVQGERVTTYDLVPNPTLPPGLFELKGPPGYTDVREGIFPRLDPELRNIAERYCQAREAIRHYRMAVYPWGQRLPHYRNIRDGDRWRLDELDIGGMLQDRDLFEVKDPSSLTALEAPYCLESLDAPVSHVVMTYHDQLAQVGFNYSTDDGGSRIRASWLTPPMLVMMTTPAEDAARLAERQKQRWYNQAPRDMVGVTADYDLRELGWPALKGAVLIAPHGWDLGTPPPVYYRLADRTDRPGLIGVRAVQMSFATDYWIDPAHDYLCAHYIEYYDPDEPWKAAPQAWDPGAYYARPRPVKPGPEPSKNSRAITEFGRTADGHWYPKSLGERHIPKDMGKTHIYLDAEGDISPAFFDWPAGAPLPGANGSVKIISFIEGTPEAKENQARRTSEQHLRNIAQGCVRYAKRHNGQWPVSLQTLVDDNYIKAEDLENPRQLAAKPGYTYRPLKQGKTATPWMHAVVWEAWDDWPTTSFGPDLPAGISVGLADGDVRFVRAKAEFDGLLR